MKKMEAVEDRTHGGWWEMKEKWQGWSSKPRLDSLASSIKYLRGGIRDHMEMISLYPSLSDLCWRLGSSLMSLRQKSSPQCTGSWLVLRCLYMMHTCIMWMRVLLHSAPVCCALWTVLTVFNSVNLLSCLSLIFEWASRPPLSRLSSPSNTNFTSTGR